MWRHDVWNVTKSCLDIFFVLGEISRPTKAREHLILADDSPQQVESETLALAQPDTEREMVPESPQLDMRSRGLFQYLYIQTSRLEIKRKSFSRESVQECRMRYQQSSGCFLKSHLTILLCCGSKRSILKLKKNLSVLNFCLD